MKRLLSHLVIIHFRYFKTDANMLHVKHYVKNCSIGDWFVLYQVREKLSSSWYSQL